jgi:hypothetical protein
MGSKIQIEEKEAASSQQAKRAIPNTEYGVEGTKRKKDGKERKTPWKPRQSERSKHRRAKIYTSCHLPRSVENRKKVMAKMMDNA